MLNINLAKAALAGFAGTVIMTVVGLYGAPMMGIPPMNPAAMLAGAMGGSMLLGWAGHFMIGIMLAVGYAAIGVHIPGPAAMRGAVYGIAPYLMAQVAVMPMMGMPFFSGFGAMAVGSLIGHLMYGAAVGAIYGAAPEEQAVPAAA